MSQSVRPPSGTALHVVSTAIEDVSNSPTVEALLRRCNDLRKALGDWDGRYVHHGYHSLKPEGIDEGARREPIEAKVHDFIDSGDCLGDLADPMKRITHVPGDDISRPRCPR